MKGLCLAASTADCYPKALVVFRGLDLAIRAAAELGYDGLELALFDRRNVELAELRGRLRENGLRVPVVSTGQLFTMKKVSFTDMNEEVRAGAVAEFEALIEIAAELGADINVSRVRGSIDERDSYRGGLDKLTGCLEKVCRRAAGLGVNVVLEQMNRYETNYLFSCAEVGDYVRSTGIPNLKIHADTFHMNIEDSDIPAVLREYADALGFIHFADSNRLAPGSGHIDFAGVVKALRGAGYAGWMGIEVLPVPDPYEAARRSIEHIRPLL